MWGVCPGRYTRRNKLTPKIIESSLAESEPYKGEIKDNLRAEYGAHYRETAAGQTAPSPPADIQPEFTAPVTGRQEILILGGAGQRIVTAGEILCLAGMTAGLNATQKNDYPITVLRGHSVSELILSPDEIEFTGIAQPGAVVAIGPEGVNRRHALFAQLGPETVVIKPAGLALPDTRAEVMEIDFKAMGVKSPDMALAALAILAQADRVLTIDMLNSALEYRFSDKVLEASRAIVAKVLSKRSGQG
jgi:Pyruvate/2-oxoacid:ferredoxin oxidoreductase gamma subunit